MRSLALIALGGLVASASLSAQSLAEHAAAASGATIGTAAGKPLGAAMGKIFGNVDNSTSKAAGTKTIKPAELKAEPKPLYAPAPGSPLLGASTDGPGSASGKSASVRRAVRRRESLAASEQTASGPIPAPITPSVAQPVVKELSVEQIAAVQVGATSSELEATLGPPESRVSIPDDDGHLLETCQYWSKGQALGTIRLDNGRVVSVQTRSY